MGIRLLLQPWWVRALYMGLWCVASALATVALIRYQHGGNPNPLDLPVPGFVIIMVACLGLAGLLAAVGAQQRERYRQALQATSTPAERSQAITAVRRGPIPDNPRVRDAARQLAWLQLSAYRKNQKTSWIVYPLVVVVWLFGAVTEWFERDFHQAISSLIFAGMFLVLLAWVVLRRRRLTARIALLDSVV
jgi:hypothetical protein